MTTTESPIRSSCHCGAITVTVNRLPEYINHCQCSICRRYGVAWGYFEEDEFTISKQPNAATKQYIWGDKDIAFHFCDTCGCVCYWLPARPPTAEGGQSGMGLNTNNVDPDLLRAVDRKWEYSMLRTPVRDNSAAHMDDLARYELRR